MLARFREVGRSREMAYPKLDESPAIAKAKTLRRTRNLVRAGHFTAHSVSIPVMVAAGVVR